MTKYYLAQNKQEYLDPKDAEMYGGGLVGFRETTTEVKEVTYTELTGQPVPESPVDHVIQKVEIIQMPTGPVPVTDLSPKEEERKFTNEEMIEHPPTPYVNPPKEEIVVQEIPKSVEIVDWNSKTDQDLRAMCKEKRVRGYAFMRRENMIKKLS